MGILLLRLFFCGQLPANTTDAARHIAWGAAVNSQGYAIVDKPLAHSEASFAAIPWSDIPFNYFPVALLFDQLIAAALPSLFFFKLVLTLLEGLGAIMIWRLTSDRLLALIYWASPVSIWWISHEGQLEALPNALSIAALVLLVRHRRWAFACLALAIQVKLMPLLLLPWFLHSLKDRKAWRDAALGFGIGLLPTALSLIWFSPFENVFQSFSLRFNPYFYNPFDAGSFAWMPAWLVTVNQLSSYGALTGLILLARNGHGWMACLAATSFIVALKVVSFAQFWYPAILPTLLLTLKNPRARLICIACCPLLDLYSAAQLFYGPFGYLSETPFPGLSAFSSMTQVGF